ncbi:hypothetical protein E2562_030544 [Oryza meyeriana var. granulata]|uniref:Uncharacterized protein n=1 Tax=Oryza meyeriana var. granulata TaxID=110450 RepID=A0A6G1DA40_9ORYZ|nr:hypothetical protein E2562_030544 [Oryza meyeriana var. granulata]
MWAARVLGICEAREEACSPAAAATSHGGLGRGPLPPYLMIPVVEYGGGGTGWSGATADGAPPSLPDIIDM